MPELADEDRGRRKRNPAPLDELTQRCTARFGGDRRARLVGLALVSHRFVVRPPDLVVDPSSHAWTMIRYRCGCVGRKRWLRKR